MIRYSTAVLAGLAVLLCGLTSSGAAQAQDLPSNLLGTYASGPGGCATPQIILHLTPRSIVTLRLHGADQLARINDTRMAGGWLVATESGDEQSRVLLRVSGDGETAGIDQAVPSDKIRDDQLPGATPIVHLVRCAALPPLLTAVHGEGLAFLHAMEAMEPPCGGNDMKACGDAFMAYADVTGDHRLTAAELARVMRGAAWVAQMAGGTDNSELALGLAGSTIAGLAVAEVIIHSYDYDGSGSITMDELMKDRVAIDLTPAPRSVGSPPLSLDRIVPGAKMLRDAMRMLH
jgi:hypothetical protein